MTEDLWQKYGMKSGKKKTSAQNRRLDRETWLEHSLETLASEGPQVLTVDKLCRALGVSRGSFYWHFKDRAEFVQHLAEFWDNRFTAAIKETVSISASGPAERLSLLSELIQDLDVVRFDVAVRSWANMEPLAAAMVRRTDQTRYRFVRSMFAELGYVGDELDMRTRTFVVFHSFDAAFSLKEGSEARKRRRLLRHRLLTGQLENN